MYTVKTTNLSWNSPDTWVWWWSVCTHHLPELKFSGYMGLMVKCMYLSPTWVEILRVHGFDGEVYVPINYLSWNSPGTWVWWWSVCTYHLPELRFSGYMGLMVKCMYPSPTWVEVLRVHGFDGEVEAHPERCNGQLLQHWRLQEIQHKQQ